MVTSSWKPSQSDLNWQTSTMSSIAEGGYWGVPATGEVYQIFFSKKEYRIVGPGRYGKETSRRIEIVFNELGWTKLD